MVVASLPVMTEENYIKQPQQLMLHPRLEMRTIRKHSLMLHLKTVHTFVFTLQ
jgi:hypothetical protein